jgi:hypothetical protein
MVAVVGALAIGLTLGLLGSGGSILTVPVLVYVVGHDGKVAIAESLAIVGSISLLGVVPYARFQAVDWRSVGFFGLPAMLGTYLGAWLAAWISASAQLSLFSLVVLVAAWFMARSSSEPNNDQFPLDQSKRQPPRAATKIVADGLAVGVITGLVGVGGGFLIVPALVLLARLDMRTAVGSSLVIIALKSFTGLYGYLDVLQTLNQSVNWSTVGLFVFFGTLGSLAGSLISAKTDQARLRKVFAVFLIVVGLLVLMREMPQVLAKIRSDAAPPRTEFSR